MGKVTLLSCEECFELKAAEKIAIVNALLSSGMLAFWKPAGVQSATNGKEVPSEKAVGIFNMLVEGDAIWVQRMNLEDWSAGEIEYYLEDEYSAENIGVYTFDDRKPFFLVNSEVKGATQVFITA